MNDRQAEAASRYNVVSWLKRLGMTLLDRAAICSTVTTEYDNLVLWELSAALAADQDRQECGTEIRSISMFAK